MFFIIENKDHTPAEQLKTNTLLKAYLIIDKYPLHASERLLDQYLVQQYKSSLKNICVKLLLNLTFHVDKENNLVMVFKDKKHDRLAQLITYGTGVIPGSRILQIALRN